MFCLLRRRPPRCSSTFTRHIGHSLSSRHNSTVSQAKRVEKPWWKHHSALEQAYAPGPSHPRTPRDLVLHILRTVTSHPRPKFHTVLNEHDAYPGLQSTDSFNILLDQANSFSPESFQELHEKACSVGMVDETTNQLYVRHLLWQGRAVDAAVFVRATYPGDTVPSAILLEFLTPPTEKRRAHFVPEDKEYKVGPPTPPPPLNMEPICSKLDAESDDPISSPLLLAAVRYFRYSGNHAEAYKIVAQYLKTLPPALSQRQLTFARDLIHELLLLPPATISPSPSPKAPSYTAALKLLRRHPQLGPTSTTLVLALEWLRRRQSRDVIASMMLKQWRDKWGEIVEDSRVRRKIASIALEQKNAFIARRMINREYAVRRERLESGKDEPNAPKRWQQARDDALWETVLKKYEKLDRSMKRGFASADQRLWSSEYINSQRVQVSERSSQGVEPIGS